MSFLTVPLVAAAIAGVLSGGLLVHFLFQSLAPGALGAVAITVLGVVLGLFTAVVVGLAALVFEMKRSMRRMAHPPCVFCSRPLPDGAEYCPHCGRRVGFVTALMKFG